jgi:hypothetical protein
MTMDDAVSAGLEAYMWGWPLVNAAKRAQRAALLGSRNPVVEGGMPVAFGRVAMLPGYMDPDERVIACPNQETVYGAGVFDLDENAIVFQVPDFGDRFWLYALYDARTNQFGKFGKQYGTKPGFYLMVGPDWDGRTPQGIPDTNMVPYSTSLAFAVPRIFMDGTAEDQAAVQSLIDQIDFYPVSEFDGKMQTRDWADWDQNHQLPPCWLPGRRDELQFVRPEFFLRDLRGVMQSVPQREGEEDLYKRINALLHAAATDPRIRIALRETFRQAEDEVITPLMQWRQNGRPAGNGWNTSVSSAEWGTSQDDYHYRTATARSNMFENRREETRYYYTDNDSAVEPLDGRNMYAIEFPADPPVNGFWSLTLYDEFHFFLTSPNPLDRYSLGSKNRRTLKYNPDGSLTLYAGGASPGADKESNWLPAPAQEPFSLYIRAYWPAGGLLDGTWQPPRVVKST